VVRVLLGQAVSDDAPGEVVVLEANLDDDTPERIAHLMHGLLARGALDAFLTPVTMKKGRPGVLLTVLGEPSRVGALEALILNESGTLGLRRRREARTVLPRRTVEVTTVYGPARVKLAERPDGRTTAKPEYEDCARLALDKDVPIADVFRAAARAAEAHAATLPPRAEHEHAHGHAHAHPHEHPHLDADDAVDADAADDEHHHRHPHPHPHDAEHPGHPHALGIDDDEVPEAPEHP
jgi:hypothetical protein